MLHFYDDAYASPGAGWICTSKHLTSIGVKRGLNGVKGNVGLADNVQGWVCYADCPLVLDLQPQKLFCVHANLRSPTRYLFSSDMSQWKIPDRKL